MYKTRKRILGEEHATLATVDRGQRRQGEAAAEDLGVVVVKTRKRLRGGAEHPKTLSSITDLAATYRGEGRQEEAEESEAVVMKSRKRPLNEEHSDTLSSIADIAATFRAQRRFKKAEELIEKR